MPVPPPRPLTLLQLPLIVPIPLLVIFHLLLQLVDARNWPQITRLVHYFVWMRVTPDWYVASEFFFWVADC